MQISMRYVLKFKLGELFKPRKLIPHQNGLTRGAYKGRNVSVCKVCLFMTE